MARAIWSGAVSFGLVTVPVKLYTAVRDRQLHLHMMSSDGQCRLRRKLFCPDTGEEYDFKEAARGYEVAPDQYVILRDEELQGLREERGRAIELTDFVDIDDIDPIYYDRAYYLVPDEAGSKSYGLLLRAMAAKGKVGIGKFVLRNREHLVALRPMEDVLAVEIMRYADEVVSPQEELEIPEAVEVNDKELELAKKLIESLETEFEPERYADEYRERLEALIEQKAQGEEVVTQAPKEEEKGKVINLMDALRKSLEETSSTSGAKKSKTTKKAKSKSRKTSSARKKKSA